MRAPSASRAAPVGRNPLVGRVGFPLSMALLIASTFGDEDEGVRERIVRVEESSWWYSQDGRMRQRNVVDYGWRCQYVGRVVACRAGLG